MRLRNAPYACIKSRKTALSHSVSCFGFATERSRRRGHRGKIDAHGLLFFFFFFFFFFCDLIPDFFLLSPLFLSLFFLSFLVSFFNPSSLVALVWFERGGDSKITG